MTSPRDAVIVQYGRVLKLPAVVREYPALCRQAQKEGWPYEDFLRELLEAEVRSRNERTIARRLEGGPLPRPEDPRASGLGCSARDLASQAARARERRMDRPA